MECPLKKTLNKMSVKWLYVWNYLSYNTHQNWRPRSWTRVLNKGIIHNIFTLGSIRICSFSCLLGCRYLSLLETSFAQTQIRNRNEALGIQRTVIFLLHAPLIPNGLNHTWACLEIIKMEGEGVAIRFCAISPPSNRNK